jgi:hypothetical protein
MCREGYGPLGGQKVAAELGAWESSTNHGPQTDSSIWLFVGSSLVRQRNPNILSQRSYGMSDLPPFFHFDNESGVRPNSGTSDSSH